VTYTGAWLNMNKNNSKNSGAVTAKNKRDEIDQEWNEIGMIPSVISELKEIASKDREFKKLSHERQKRILRILSEELEQEFQDRLGACLIKFVKHEAECRKAKQGEQ
jgi:hypothetical protein